MHQWQYTVKDDGVDLCIWIPNFIFPDPVEAWLSFILQLLSIGCLFITLFTYSVFTQLRNLPGLNLMALATVTLLYQVTFVALVNPDTASNIGNAKQMFV